jgi:hypothetical protein
MWDTAITVEYYSCLGTNYVSWRGSLSQNRLQVKGISASLVCTRHGSRFGIEVRGNMVNAGTRRSA